MAISSTRNFSIAKSARILTAFGAALSLDRDATQIEVDAELSDMVIRLVFHQERMARTKLIVDNPM